MSMTRDQILRYLDDPAMLNERTLGELREILNEYPYFQTAHLLYMRNLQNENNFRFSGQLRTSALYASDRSILYHLLNSEPEKKRTTDQPLEISVQPGRNERPMMELLDDSHDHQFEPGESLFPVTDRTGKEHSELLNFELNDKSYTLESIEIELNKSLLDSGEEPLLPAVKKKKGKASLQKTDLIDRFIKDNPAFTVKQPENPVTGEKINKQIYGAGENEDFITETLARIYVNQGLYEKAIKAFEKLSLKYPEKSVYFARQIEEVTNLINK
jgi:hypothetical protein